MCKSVFLLVMNLWFCSWCHAHNYPFYLADPYGPNVVKAILNGLTDEVMEKVKANLKAKQEKGKHCYYIGIKKEWSIDMWHTHT